MRACWLAAAVVTASIGTVAADPPGAGAADDAGDPGGIALEPLGITSGRTFSERIAEQLTLLGDAVNGHVGVLTLDAVKFRIDGHARRARLRITGGQDRYLALRLDGDIHFRGGAAEVDATLGLVVAGHAMRFELPDFEVLPRSYLGERYVEVRVPLIRGSF